MNFKREDADASVSPEDRRVVYAALGLPDGEHFNILARKDGVHLEVFHKCSFEDWDDVRDVMQQAFWHHSCIAHGHKIMRGGEPKCVIEVKLDKPQKAK